MEIKNSLKTILKRLKLSGILATLPERIAYAQKTKLPSEDLLELILQDEVDRRDQVNLQRRLKRASFTEEQIFENFDWDAPVGFDRHRVRDLFSLSFLEAKQDVLFMGSVGVGKTFLASALGHAACRAGYGVLFIRADQMFLELKQSRADYSHEKALRRFLAPDLLILDDFALRRLDTCRSSLLIGAGTAGSCAPTKKNKKKARSTCARQCRRHVDCGLDDRKQERSRLRAKRRAPLETALRSFPPLVSMVKATHSRQRHDLGRV